MSEEKDRNKFISSVGSEPYDITKVSTSILVPSVTSIFDYGALGRQFIYSYKKEREKRANLNNLIEQEIN